MRFESLFKSFRRPRNDKESKGIDKEIIKEYSLFSLEKQPE
jgi:hypothetical protein